MTSLVGTRILIVEDDFLQAHELARQFSELGAEVIGPAATIESGLQLAPKADTAILDLAMRGELVFPVADSLHERGAPIVFYSAHSDIRIPERFHFASRLSKPATAGRIADTMRSALGTAPGQAAEVTEMLPRLRLAALLLLHDARAADRLVETALRRALETPQPEGEALEPWLTRLVHDTAEDQGRDLMT